MLNLSFQSLTSQGDQHLAVPPQWLLYSFRLRKGEREKVGYRDAPHPEKKDDIKM